MDLDRLARAAYEAYGRNRQWRDYRDEPLPVYDELGEGIRAGWQAAAGAVAAVTGAELIEAQKSLVNEIARQW